MNMESLNGSEVIAKQPKLDKNRNALKHKLGKVSTVARNALEVEDFQCTTEAEKYDQAAVNFAKSLHKLIEKEKLLLGAKNTDKVVEFKHPLDLKKVIKLKIDDDGETNKSLLSICEDIIKYSVKTGSTSYYNQLTHGGDPYGIAAAWLTESLNTSEFTFEVAPVFSIVSDYIITRLTQMAGYEYGDGIFVPGGSMGNIMALSMARYNFNADIKTKGMCGFHTMVIFASEDSHYSTQKAAALLGFGMDNLIAVKTDHRGRMSTEDLKLKIQAEKDKGHAAVAVVATAGSTVLGAFDDLEEVAKVCQEHKLWMHVDSCWGGGTLFSPKHRGLLKGIEKSDSFCISLHKMTGAPIQCSPLLTKRKGILQQTFGASASYLFQKDKFYDVSYDMGDKTIQCGRKADALKFWFMWKARGDLGMAAHVDHVFNMAAVFKTKLQAAEGFRMVLPEFDCTNVGFWYIPPSMRDQEENDEWWEKLGKVAPVIKKRMQLKGSLLISYQPLRSKSFVNFFRIIFESARLTEQDLDFVIDEISNLGSDL